MAFLFGGFRFGYLLCLGECLDGGVRFGVFEEHCQRWQMEGGVVDAVDIARVEEACIDTAFVILGLGDTNQAYG